MFETAFGALRGLPTPGGAGPGGATPRAAVARAALARAELAVGVGGPAAAVAPNYVTEDPLLPAGLDAVLPGGLPPGTVLGVRGAASLRNILTAAAMGEDGWAVFVGFRDVGWVACAEAGCDLARVVVVPAAGPTPAQVVAACVDAFGVVVLGDVAIGAGERRSLAGRVRSNGAVLLATSWPGAPTLEARVHGSQIGPDGLTSRTISVTREGTNTTAMIQMGQKASAGPRRHLEAV